MFIFSENIRKLLEKNMSWKKTISSNMKGSTQSLNESLDEFNQSHQKLYRSPSIRLCM
jgi:hypothetical protein